ncbi:nucleotidyltransferase substrate binding protein [candidate division KSB1 bacterium]|nr:nucleotidyltransferase substrate binding protein [candidate division KSB1 bacterium]
MNQKDIRWRQRFENFKRAHALLAKYIGIENPSEIERAGIIQFFEMAFELAWKLMKDYLEAQGFQPQSPRETIKQAFQAGIIVDGHAWIDALDDRNLTVHTYDESTSIEIEQRIKTIYFQALQKFYQFMKREAEK